MNETVIRNQKGQSRASFIVGEIFNAITHGIGVGLAITALVLLILKGASSQNLSYLLSYITYGISLILLFLASTLYHSLKFTRAVKVFQRIDHSSIYLLIAGSYTPFCIVAIGGLPGLLFCLGIWLLALVGIFIESFFLEKLGKLSLLLNLGMGWLAIFTLRPLYLAMGWTGLVFLVLGGLSYSIGALFYKQKSNNFYHVVWHIFVLAGAIFMFFAVYLFL